MARKSTSGWVSFAIVFLCVVSAIGATLLLANDYRNLNLLLTHFSYPPIVVKRDVHLRPYQTKTKRLPRPLVTIPDRLVDRNVPIQTRFARDIGDDPKTLCDALQKAGFPGSEWKQARFDPTAWECTSYREFPTDRDGSRIPSSAFLVVKGSQEARVSSFRIKLNLDNPNTQPLLTDAVIAAIQVFLTEVRWEDIPEVTNNIRALKNFNFIQFGNRMQLKKEFSQTPRYNFLITPDHKGRRQRFLPDYFDRSRWLPLPPELAQKPKRGPWGKGDN